MPTPRIKHANSTTGTVITGTAAPKSDLPVALQRRVITEYVDINDITPYDWNPRDNADAVDAVAKAIRAFGFLVPCVLDKNNVLITGHTRVEAAKLLGLTEIPCIRASELTPEEANSFRLIDNKVAEKAEWNYELLAGEMDKLSGTGIDFTEFGWTQAEVDCMHDLVAADCLNPSTLVQGTPEETATQQIRRSPVTARFVLGELMFMLPAAQYHTWVDGIRQLCNFDEDAITAELKRRLAILD